MDDGSLSNGREMFLLHSDKHLGPYVHRSIMCAKKGKYTYLNKRQIPERVQAAVFV